MRAHFVLDEKHTSTSRACPRNFNSQKRVLGRFRFPLRARRVFCKLVIARGNVRMTTDASEWNHTRASISLKLLWRAFRKRCVCVFYTTIYHEHRDRAPRSTLGFLSQPDTSRVLYTSSSSEPFGKRVSPSFVGFFFHLPHSPLRNLIIWLGFSFFYRVHAIVARNNRRSSRGCERSASSHYTFLTRRRWCGAQRFFKRFSRRWVGEDLGAGARSPGCDAVMMGV